MARQKKPMPLSTRAKLLKIEEQLATTFVQRNQAIRTILLATLAQEHYLMVGDPGTGKSKLASCFQSHIAGSRFFKALLGKFTPPDELFGALDINAFKTGQYKRMTTGMLPDAHFAMLDEGFKCNDGSLNSLLGVLNEREFGGKKVPLMTCGTATNWPELDRRTEMVAALYDRFLLRCIVQEVEGEDNQVKVLEASDKVEHYVPNLTITLDDLKAATVEVDAVTIANSVRKVMIRVRTALADTGGAKKAGVHVSTRRMGKLQRVLKASAWLAGRDQVTLEDFTALQMGLWNNRTDYIQVDATLKSLDGQAIQDVTAVINDGLKAIKRYNATPASSKGPAQLSRALVAASKKAKAAKTMLAEPVFTADGRQKVGRVFTGFKSAFEQLSKEAAAVISQET